MEIASDSVEKEIQIRAQMFENQAQSDNKPHASPEGAQYAATEEEKQAEERKKATERVLAAVDAEVEKLKSDNICDPRVRFPETLEHFAERTYTIAAGTFVGPTNYQIYNEEVAFCPQAYFRHISGFENWKSKMKAAGKDFGIVGIRRDTLLVMSDDAKDLFSSEFQKKWIRELKIAKVRLEAQNYLRMRTLSTFATDVAEVAPTLDVKQVTPTETKETMETKETETDLKEEIFLDDIQPPRSLSLRDQVNVGAYQYIDLVPHVPILLFLGAGWIDPRRSDVAETSSGFHAFMNRLQGDHPSDLGPFVELRSEEWKPVVYKPAPGTHVHVAKDSGHARFPEQNVSSMT